MKTPKPPLRDDLSTKPFVQGLYAAHSYRSSSAILKGLQRSFWDFRDIHKENLNSQSPGISGPSDFSRGTCSCEWLSTYSIHVGTPQSWSTGKPVDRDSISHSFGFRRRY